MSYDIQLGVRVHGVEPPMFAVLDSPEFDHPTYNVGRIIRKSTGWDFNQGEWYCVRDVIQNIEKRNTRDAIQRRRV